MRRRRRMPDGFIGRTRLNSARSDAQRVDAPLESGALAWARTWIRRLRRGRHVARSVRTAELSAGRDPARLARRPGPPARSTAAPLGRAPHPESALPLVARQVSCQRATWTDLESACTADRRARGRAWERASRPANEPRSAAPRASLSTPHVPRLITCSAYQLSRQRAPQHWRIQSAPLSEARARVARPGRRDRAPVPLARALSNHLPDRG